MSPSDLAGLARRHLIAVTIILLVAAGTAYTFKHSPPNYTESATAVLTAPGGNPYTSYGGSMLATGEFMADWTMSTQVQQKVREATGSDDFSVELLNFGNQEYPYYVDPYLIVSASAQDPVAAHQLFTTVTRLVNDHLAALQRREGVAPVNRITISMIGDSGPLIQVGSNKRSFAGLLVLTIVVAYLILKFLDRRSIRLHGLLRLRRRNPAARDPLTTSRRTSVA